MLRVTDSIQLAQAQRNLQASKARLNALDNEAATGLRISRPSDDPAGTANLMNIQRELVQNTQYQRNASNGTGWLNTVDSTLTSVAQSLTQLRDLTVQAASDTNSASAEASITDQMQAIKQNLLSLANTQYLGRNVFAGTSDAATAFNHSDYSYNGTPGATVDRRVGANTTIQVNADGSALFGVGPNSMFALIDTITGDLAGGTNVGPRLADIDTFLTNIEGIHAAIGAAQDHMQQVTTALSTAATTLQTNLSGVQNVDPATVILEMETQQVAYQTALEVAARSLQPTLMDYLR